MQVQGVIADLDYPPDATAEAVALALVNAIKRMGKQAFREPRQLHGRPQMAARYVCRMSFSREGTKKAPE